MRESFVVRETEIGVEREFVERLRVKRPSEKLEEKFLGLYSILVVQFSEQSNSVDVLCILGVCFSIRCFVLEDFSEISTTP